MSKKSLAEMTEEQILNAFRITPAELLRWQNKHFSMNLAENPPPIDPEKPEFISTRVPGLKFDAASGRWVADV